MGRDGDGELGVIGWMVGGRFFKVENFVKIYSGVWDIYLSIYVIIDLIYDTE